VAAIHVFGTAFKVVDGRDTPGPDGGEAGQSPTPYSSGTGGGTGSGTISGVNAIVSTGAGATIGSITNSGLISGNISISNQNVTISGGTGSTFGTLTGGRINIANGNLLFYSGNELLDDDISVNSGTGTVTNQGVLQIATSHTITGSLAQLASGVLEVEIAGTGAGQFGSLSVSGGVTLAGGLDVDLTNGFTLTAGESFDILNGFANISGDFASFSLDGIACTTGGADIWDCSNLGGGLYLAEVFNGNQLDLVVDQSGGNNVPEPASLGLFAAALAGLGAARRRWRRPGGAQQSGRVRAERDSSWGD
jgi:hypothetical protein